MSHKAPVEFGISAVTLRGPTLIVEGRCHIGPIRRGDVFTTISEITVERTPERYGPTTLHPIAAVELKVVAIEAYGRELTELTQSLTARMILTGTGGEQVKSDLVLSG
jgi:hypothetical protein